MKKNIVIIGAGNLGRRHMQGLKLSVSDLQIIVVDTNRDALILAKKYYADCGLGGRLKTYMRLEEVQEPIDIAIVATTANSRLKIFRSLINLGVKYLVIEKIAFNSLQDIEEARKLIKNSNSVCWVNCPRRLYSYYQDLKISLSAHYIESFNISGGGFGMACNSIHFIDLLSFLTNSGIDKIDMSKVTDIEESKRKGFYEFFGNISGVLDNGTSFSFTCEKKTSTPLYNISMVFEGGGVEIDEMAKTATLSLPKSIPLKCDFDMPYQSLLTGALVDEIIATGSSNLVGFEESMRQHIPFVREAYGAYSRKISENSERRVFIT
jgi:predicted dehydrogenase